MTEEIIKKIYKNTISTVLENIDSEVVNDLCAAYYEYLLRNYSNFDTKGKNEEEVITIFSQLEKSKWSNMNSGMKKSELLKDEAFEHIKYISGMGLKYAQERVVKNSVVLDAETADKYIDLLNEYLPKVQKFNVFIAQNYVSEGIMDLQFASGKTNDMSLRIGRMIK